jgi:hypothetical protein
MMEIRHLAGAPARRPGAVVSPPGDFIYHAVAVIDRFSRERIDATVAELKEERDAVDRLDLI